MRRNKHRKIAYYERAAVARLLPVPRAGKRTPVRGHRHIAKAATASQILRALRVSKADIQAALKAIEDVLGKAPD